MSIAAPASSGGPVAHVLSEALDALATPEIRATILSRALAVAGLDVIPESGPDVRRFVEQFFRAAVVSTLGEAAAEHVCLGLEPIVQMAEAQEAVSEVRPATPREKHSRPRAKATRDSSVPTDAPPPINTPVAPSPAHASERPTWQAESGPDMVHVKVPQASKTPDLAAMGLESSFPPLELEELPELPNERPNSEAPEFPDVAELAMETGPVGPIVVCSPLSFVAKALGKAIGTQQDVHHAASELDLADLLDATDGPVPVAVVVDCRSEAMDVGTVASILSDHDPAPLLVLWGATSAMQNEVASASDHIRCLPVPKDCDVHELAARCASAG
jgi:hypothetical protein